MSEQIKLDGLLFSKDAQVVGVVGQILKTFAIEIEAQLELSSALEAISQRHFDAVLVDWNGAEPTRIVRHARNSSPNSNATIVAMVDRDSDTHALLVGANFMIYKPVDLERARRCMRAAYGTMLRQRRRSARVSVDLPVLVRLPDSGALDARVSDLSISGLALHSRNPLPLDQTISLLIKLPGSGGSIRVTGTVVNVNAAGRAGVRFSFVPDEDLNLLERWLATELAKLEHAELPV